MAIPANVRVQVGVPFPAQVNGAGGILVTKSNGIYTIQPNFAALSVLTPAAALNPATKQVWVFDPISGLYNTMTLAGLGDALYKLTSTTSILIGAGSPVFVTQPNKEIGVGSWVIATSNANPANYMAGQVTAYDAVGNLTIGVSAANIGGSGTHADWTLRASGPPGPQGVPGSGSVAGATTHGIAIATSATSVSSSAALTDGQLIVGQTGGDPLPKTVTGDVTITAAGATSIGAAKVTAAMLAANAVPIYETVAAATGASIPAAFTTIYLRGYLAAGDPGGGWWTRSAGNPGHTAFFNSSDGAFWSPSLANGIFPFEMFGGSAGGSGFDNTPALVKYKSFIAQVGQQRCRLQPATYFFNSATPSFTSVAPYFEGTGTNATTLQRNYSGSAGVGFLQFTGVSGVTIKDLSIEATAGTSVGDAMRFDATASNGSSGSFLSNVTIAGLGTDNFQNMVTIDGHLKATGAIGSRDHNWVGVTIFGSATSAVNCLSVEGFTWNGGGVYPAGGSSNAPIIISGLSAPMASNVVNINIAEGGDVSLDFAVRCILRSSAWSNSLNSANTNICGVGGNVPGTKNTNWTNSNYLAF